MKNSVHGVRVKYSDLFESKKEISMDIKRINLKMKSSYSYRDWTYSYGTLFKAIKMEKFVVYLLLASIILVAIFLAVYPMIGNGYDQFMNDFNINEVGNFVSNMVNGLASFIDNFKS